MPLIAVSRCLLGDRVRYDGEVKYFTDLLDYIQTHFQTIAVCPEVEIGLSVPRPPVQLTGTIDNIKLTGRDDAAIDITQPMQHYCQQRPAQLHSIQGYIFKSKSPSCGIKDIPVFGPQGQIITTRSGLFAHAVLQHYPNLPITDEQGLISNQQRERFLQHVQHYRQAAN